MKVTFFGTTTLLFDDGKDAILFDGFFTRPLLPLYRVGKVTTDTALADDFMSRYDFSRLRAIFVSHTHPDPTRVNNDIGKTIDEPLRQPARLTQYKEGGSFDFLVKHGEKTYLIRPSFNYIKGQLDGIKADILFLGIGTMAKASDKKLETFFAETLDKVQPEKVIPLHWDDFFLPLTMRIRNMPLIADNTPKNFDTVARACAARGMEFIIQYPLVTLDA